MKKVQISLFKIHPKPSYQLLTFQREDSILLESTFPTWAPIMIHKIHLAANKMRVFSSVEIVQALVKSKTHMPSYHQTPSVSFHVLTQCLQRVNLTTQ